MSEFTFNNLIYSITQNGLGESAPLPAILNMSITASVIIVFVLLVRLLLKKAPKIFSYALWAVVLFRLLCPVSITTDFSLLGLFDTPVQETTEHTTVVEYVPHDVVHTPDLEVHLPAAPVINEAVNEALPQEHAALGADPMEGPMSVATMIWLAGIGAMAIYSVVSYLLLRRKIVGAAPLRDNIYLADQIGSPFVMGFIRLKIYLPSALSEQEQAYIILHEQHHIRRLDHLVKVLAFIALCIHWFNPLVWVAFVLSSKDMEMSCDEAVVKKLGESIRADYSASLLSLATGRRIIAGTPLAFGEGDTKSRIKNMLNWKQPKVWLMVIAAVVVVVAAIICGTNANTRSTVKTKQTENGVEVTLTLKEPIRSYAIYEEIYQDGLLISGKPKMLSGFIGDDWGEMPYKHTFKLGVQAELLSGGGFSGELTSWHEENGAAAERKTNLPKDAYTGMARVVGTGNAEGTLSGETHSIDAGDGVLLFSVALSTEPDGEVCVYRNGWSLAKGNDTVVQYRLMTSTETAEIFEEMPLDLAQTLYDLRVESLTSQNDSSVQASLAALLGVLEISRFGSYEVSTFDSADDTVLHIQLESTLDNQQEAEMTNLAYLLHALVPAADRIDYSYPTEGGSSIMTFYHDGTPLDNWAKQFGYKDIRDLGQSATGIRTLMRYLGGWSKDTLTQTPGTASAQNSYGTAEDAAYYLELSALGKTFQEMDKDRRVEILSEYDELLEDYTLLARESTDGKTAYIVGSYNGNMENSPLYMMDSMEVDGTHQMLYTQEQETEVNENPYSTEVGHLIQNSRISFSSNNGIILIQPEDTEEVLDYALSRYLYTPNGREYIANAASRGIAINDPAEPYLCVYLISERFGEIAEKIPLSEAEAAAILADERVELTKGFGFAATLHMDGETGYYTEQQGVPRPVLDLAVEKCGYKFADPSYITGPILEARLDCDWLAEPLYADEAQLSRLEDILKNAEFGYVGACGYGAKLTFTLTGGETLTVFKGTDSCDTIVFGSYGGYFIGHKENMEFWEMFGLDPDTKELKAANSKERALLYENGEIAITIPAKYADLVKVDDIGSDNMFTVAANLYYAPDHFQHEGDAPTLNGGWMLTAETTLPASAASLARDPSTEWARGCWTRDGTRVYMEHRPAEGHYNCDAANLEEFKSVLESIEVHYSDDLKPFSLMMQTALSTLYSEWEASFNRGEDGPSFKRVDANREKDLVADGSVFALFEGVANKLQPIENREEFKSLPGSVCIYFGGEADRHISFFAGEEPYRVLLRYVGDDVNESAIVNDPQLYLYLKASAEKENVHLRDLDGDGAWEGLVWLYSENNLIIYDFYDEHIYRVDTNETLGCKASDYTGLIANMKPEYNNMVQAVNADGSIRVNSYNNGEFSDVCSLNEALG